MQKNPNHPVDPVFLALPEEEVPPSSEWLSDREAERERRMRFAKRRNDFRLGRWTAKRALALALGESHEPATLRHIEVVNAPDGAPEAFVRGRAAGLSISMTDRAGWAVCTTAPAGLGLGCDLELVEPRSDAFVRDFLTEGEQRVVATSREAEERHLLANLFWCAKESALKVLRTGLRRDTRSVEVELAGSRTGTDWEPLRVHAIEGRTFPGWWRRYNDFVLTVTATAEVTPPRSFVEPSALHGAVPTDYWLAELR
jgi:4'-phosphopantetheinyl transferase